MDLSEIRKEIDRVDADLMKAFLERMELSEQVAAYKLERGIPILNREREKAVLDKANAAAGEQGRFAVPLYAVLMALSRTRQAEMSGTDANLERELLQAIEDWKSYQQTL